MPTGGFAHAGGVEAGALQEDVGGGFGHTGVEAAEHAGDAEGFLCVADHQVGFIEGVLHAVEGGELCALFAGADGDAAVDFGQIEAVEGLPHAVEDVVGDVDHIVDGV